jgi:hypothetical protein
MNLQFIFSHLADFTLAVHALDEYALRLRAAARQPEVPEEERELMIQNAGNAYRIAREMEQRSFAAVGEPGPEKH